MEKTKSKKQKNLLDESYLDPKNQKLKITMWLDGDIYDELKKRAEKNGAKYQTLMNHMLRESLFEKSKSDDLRVQVIDVLKELGFDKLQTKKRKNAIEL